VSGRLHGRYLSVAEAAALLDRPERTVRSWCSCGRLRTRPGRSAGAPYKVVRSSAERVKRELEGG
jgi:hypothetical protein